MAVKQPSKHTHFYERSIQTHPFGAAGGGTATSGARLEMEWGGGVVLVVVAGDGWGRREEWRPWVGVMEAGRRGSLVGSLSSWTDGGLMFSVLGSSVSFVASGFFSTTGGGIEGPSYEIPLWLLWLWLHFLGSEWCCLEENLNLKLYYYEDFA
nr:hypothetical protein [Tanacetum cinerariifolium]